ncbi:Ca-activated chloride channel family protein [Prosthecobacter fusiformis]|uniref:Ca-activated chloride channel family protein n=2 Tax=Prosthecobacter fusiformis TaxID=48464 RepID=A0A4R7SRR0_9BACT|nr:Ca-activated chloride channel family protein [Prosthecobacter fusiformis]
MVSMISPGPAQEVAAPARAVLILDASGSMWGKIDGRAKIDIARAAITQIIEGLDPRLHLGLMVYGHRKRGDCADIEMLIQPGPVDKAAFIKTMNAILPKGRTPLTGSLVQAAQILKNTEQKATVILVSDGIETCDQDPCVAVKELESLGIDFTAHVVGFDLGSDEQDAIRCIAETTGGEFLAASDSSTLLNALATAMVKTADPEAPAPAPIPLPAPAPEPPPPAPKAEVEIANVTLLTVLAEGGEAVTSFFTITAEGKPEIVARGSGGSYKLAPGKYQVKATWGSAAVTENITVPAEPESKFTLVYNAGILRLQALASEGGEKVKAFFTISRAGKDLKGNRPRVTAGSGNEFQLPAGEYHVLAKWGKSQAEDIFEVTPGEVTEGELIANAGVLKLTASPVAGGEQVKAFYTILDAAAKLDGSRQQISSGTGSEHQIPAGRYLIRAKWGEVTGETEAEVQAGEATKAHVLVPGGVLNVTPKDAAGTVVKTYTTIYSAKTNLEGKRTRITAGSVTSFILPAGEYSLEAKIGTQTVSIEAVVKAGEASSVVLQAK